MRPRVLRVIATMGQATYADRDPVTTARVARAFPFLGGVLRGFSCFVRADVGSAGHLATARPPGGSVPFMIPQQWSFR